MQRSKPPQQKKKESYARDRFEAGECPHADRKNRPRAKARARRWLRRKTRQTLASQTEETVQFPTLLEPAWRKSNEPLARYLDWSRANRLGREARRIFDAGYGPGTHERFRQVVTAWMEGETEYSRTIAELYWGVMNGFPDELQKLSKFNRVLEEPFPGGGAFDLSLHRDFLARFFAHEPGLEKRFQSWITKLTKQEFAPDIPQNKRQNRLEKIGGA